jgi:hypothetical protein
MAYDKPHALGIIRLTCSSKIRDYKGMKLITTCISMLKKKKNLILILYVDDLLITRNHDSKIQWFIV